MTRAGFSPDRRDEEIALGRASGAPRLIEWTGERCVPWAPDTQVVYEHFHRYLWAADLVNGRRVLDLASGEGFGAAILARTATEVIGVDIDQQAVDHASLNYASSQISFAVGDATDLSSFPDESFGAVVAFEMIEHVVDQARVLSEVTRVLAPDGLFIVSTPDRDAYTPAGPEGNPFHVHELSAEEFSALLGAHFAHVAVWGQRSITGSTLSQVVGPRSAESGWAAGTYFVERHNGAWTASSAVMPVYLVAVASRAQLPTLPSESTLADGDLHLLREAERAAAADRNGPGGGERISRELAQREVEIENRRQYAAALELELSRMARLSAELDEAREVAAEMTQSITWKAFRRIQKRLFAAIGGRDSRLVRILQSLIRAIAQVSDAPVASGPVPVSFASIHVPRFEDPDVSIVVPLHARADLTEACLRSIIEHTSLISYEVILVDDDADGDTKALLAAVDGAHVIVNEPNLGYLRSVNLGAQRACGAWIVLCNNDIEVREGWLDALLDCAGSADDVGIVTPRYLFPDLTINEAGGIIWRDATGMNYGRGQPTHLFHFGFRREVDYGSAAALLVRASLWRVLGGYDERYAPMYYEDADLCFAAREHGFRVLYEPQAEVIHIEGATAGTDVAAGHKRFQEINRRTFAQKWDERMSKQPRNDGLDLRSAANRGRGPRVLIVDYRVPSRDRDAGSLRLWYMIDSLIALGCRITFLPDDRKLLAPYGPELERRGVEIWHGDINVHAELEVLGPELSMVLLCRPHTAARWLDLIREQAPRARVVYDTVDLHWLREVRRDGGSGLEDLSPGSKAAALREIELAAVRASDAVLTVSDVERRLLEADVPGADIRVVPTVHPINRNVPSFEARTGVVFVGGFDHPPNVDAVIQLIEEVMPLVWRELGGVPVTIVGGSVPEKVRRLASSLVDVAGWVPEIEPVLDRARVMVAPLSWGAGVKGKVTQAMAAGLPVVTTVIGAEGLEATDGDQLLIADDPDLLAERVIVGLTDPVRWAHLSVAGLAAAEARFSPAAMHAELGRLVDEATVGSVRRRPVLHQSPR